MAVPKHTGRRITKICREKLQRVILQLQPSLFVRHHTWQTAGELKDFNLQVLLPWLRFFYIIYLFIGMKGHLEDEQIG